MTRFDAWLQVGPDERGAVIRSTLTASIVMAFFTLARALRETLFLTAFPATALPYLTAATAAVTLPAVSLFTWWLGRRRPRSVVLSLTVIVGTAILLLWPFVSETRVAVVAFYLVTAAGGLLLASGFWVVAAEIFPVRDAKRLYGVITAGGTVGAMVGGFSLRFLAHWVPLDTLVFTLMMLLGLLVLALLRLPSGHAAVRTTAPAMTAGGLPLRDALVECSRTPHLRSIAALVYTAAVASAVVDFQFKATAQAAHPSAIALSSFLGTFYACTGAAALLIQLFVAPRLLSERGVGSSLAVLPATLISGAVAVALAPGVTAATLLRAADNTLRRAIQRPVIEYLYVPLSAAVRRRTKTVIDTIFDSAAEATGAAVVLAWVTFGRLPARGLSLMVAALGVVLLILGRRMAGEYRRTVVDRLQEAAADAAASGSAPTARDLFTAGFSRLDLSAAQTDLPAPAFAAPGPTKAPLLRLAERLQSPDNATAAAALGELDAADGEQLTAAVRLLARDPLRDAVTAGLAGAGAAAHPFVVAALRDPATPFAIRRRLPRLLARVGDTACDDALLDALSADRFEVRYRAAVALGQRRRYGLPESPRDWRRIVWNAISTEVAHERPVWELQRLLDDRDQSADDWLVHHVDVRGSLSLEHTFRLLGLVLDPVAVAAAFQGITTSDSHLHGYALEYLEQVLPPQLRERLWLFIGDISERRRARDRRPLDDVLRDLMNSRATLFPGETGLLEMRRLLDAKAPPPTDDATP